MVKKVKTNFGKHSRFGIERRFVYFWDEILFETFKLNAARTEIIKLRRCNAPMTSQTSTVDELNKNDGFSSKSDIS